MAGEIEGITVRFGANTVDYDNSIKGMNRGLAALRKEFSNLGRELKLDPSNIDTLNSRLKNLQQQAQIGAKKIEELKSQQAALNETGGPKSSEWIKLENEIQKTTGQMQVVQRAIAATNKAISDLDPNSVKSLEQQFENLAKELDLVDRRLKLDPKNTDAINAKVGILRQQLDNTTQRAEALRQEMAHVDQTNVDSKDIQELKLQLSEAEVQAEELKKALESADPKSLKNIGTSVQHVGQKMTEIGKTMSTYVTAPIVAGFAAAIKVGNDFEAQMSRVGAVAGSSKSELKALTDQAIELGAKTAFSAKEAADGMENLASAGFSSKEIMEAIPGVLDLAAVSGGDVALAADNMASALRGFGLAATDSAHVSNVFARAAADTNAEVSDMGEAMKYIAPVAHAMGLSIEETAAAVGIMSDAGIKGSQAGTSLRGALTRLSKPTASMYDVMTQLGLSFFDAQGKMKPLADIIGMLREKTSGLTQEQKASAYATLFGQEALSGMLALVDAGPDKMSQLTQSFVHSDGAAKSMAQQMQDNAKSAVEQLGGAMESLGITIQQKIAPAITAIANGLSNMIQAFLNLNPAVQNVILILTGVAAAIGPLLVIVGTLTRLVGTAMVGWQSIVGVWTAVSGAVSSLVGFFGSLWAVMLANPIIAIVAAVAALVAGIAFLVLKTQAGQKAWEEFSSMMSTAFVSAKNAVTNGISVIMAAIDPLIGKFNSLIASFGGWSGIWDSVKSTLVSFGQSLLNISGPITSLSDVFLNLAPAVLALFAPIGMVTKLLISFAAAFVQTGSASGAITLMSDNFTNLVTNILGALTTVINGITAAMPTIISVGVQIITTLITAIVSALPQLITAATQIITNIFDALVAAMPTLISAATQIITTLVQGLVVALPALIAVAIMLISQLVTALIQNLPQIIAAGVQLIMALVNGIVTLMPMIIQAAIQIIMALINGLIQNLPQIIAAGVQLIMALVNGIVTLMPMIIQAAIQIITALINGLIQNLPQIIAAGVQLITALISGLIQMIPMLINAAIQLATALIQTLVDNAVNFLSAGASVIGSVMNTIWSVITSVWNNISSAVSSVVQSIASTIGSIWNSIMSTVSGVMNSIRSVVTSVWNGIMGTISGIMNGIMGTVSGIWNSILGVINGVVGAIRGVISGGFGAIPGIVSGAFNGALSAASSVIGGFASIGGQIVSAIVNSITGLGEAIAGKIRSAISSAKQAASNIIGSIFGKGSDGNFNVGFGNAMGGIGSFYKVKAAGMPQLAEVAGGTTNNTSINIKVDAQGTDAVSIADAVERRIVRRLSF